MRIWSDLFTGDEVISDAFPFQVVDDIVYKFKSKLSKVNTKEIKVYDGDAFGGKNEDDAEEKGTGAEKQEETADTVNEVVNNFHLEQITFTSLKEYQASMKNYSKALVDKLVEDGKSDRADAFKKNIGKFLKDFFGTGKFEDIEFYLGPAYNVDAMIILQKWEENNTVPCLYYFKDGLRETKI